MDNSDGSHSENASDAALKRPSARRVTAESEPPPESSNSEITAKMPRRVHARRPTLQADADGGADGTDAGEAGRASSVPQAPLPGPLTDEPTSGNPSQPVPRATARASARSARGVAGRDSTLPPAPPSSRSLQPTAAAADAAAPTLTLPLTAADPIPARSSRRSDISAISPAANSRNQERSLSRDLAWHSDAVLTSAGHGEEILSTPMASALARADFADDFGLDAGYEARLRPWLEALCKRYFHVEVVGAHNIPAQGRALLVANHSRSALWDGIILRTALRLQHESGREPRWLVDDQQYHAPFLGTFVNRLGAVRACQENAERLLLREELVAVFPEGAKAAERRFEDRYRLQRFGRGGYVKLALRTGAPVIPVAIVAHDRDYAAWLSRLSTASRLLSTPMLALRPGLPRLGRLGVPPIASHIQICIGEPVREIAQQDALAVRDDGIVHELNECVRVAVQQLVNASLQI
jgi:hypothetical protein